MGLWDRVKGFSSNIGEYMAAEAFGGPGWRERMAVERMKPQIAEAELAGTQARTRASEAATRASEAGLVTEGLRQDQLRQAMDEITRQRGEWDAAVRAGRLKGENAAIQKAMLDQAEAELTKRVQEANIEQSRAAAARSRAETGRINDPTRQALELLALRDVHRQRRAQTSATEALTEARERPPARTPGRDLMDAATAYDTENINRGKSGGFFGIGRSEDYLEEGTPAYMREMARLKQEWYKANPETRGGWSAGVGPGAAPEPPGGPQRDGIYLDGSTGRPYMIKGGMRIELQGQDAPVSLQGLGEPGQDFGWE